ncbi:hypothetical protein phiFa_37 [Thermus phage phiFa]|nr:hypothetical protein phiFa_37 [Thermus phage phiFa]
MYSEKLMIRRVAMRRMRAKVAFLVRDLEDYVRLFYRSQKGLSRKGYKAFKHMKNRERRSREKQALRAWLTGDELRFERLNYEGKKELMWWLW